MSSPALQEDAMAQLSISLLGPFRVRVDGQDVGVLRHRKSQELLAYLLINPSRSHHRSTLTRVLWPDNDMGRRYLRQAIWHLHREGTHPILQGLVTSEYEEFVRLAHHGEYELDVHELQTAAQELRDYLPQGVELERLFALMHNYAPFMEGCDADWVCLERQHIQSVYFRLVNRVMSLCIEARQLEIARGLGQRILRFDGAHEATHALLMRIHQRLGDRAAALRQYQLCADAMNRELHATPAATTQDLYEQLRSDKVSGIHPVGTAA